MIEPPSAILDYRAGHLIPVRGAVWPINLFKLGSLRLLGGRISANHTLGFLVSGFRKAVAPKTAGLPLTLKVTMTHGIILRSLKVMWLYNWAVVPAVPPLLDGSLTMVV